MANGLFITFEGTEGCGKTTQLQLLAETLRNEGKQVITTREPGGTDIGKEIRTMLLSPRKNKLSCLSEIFLFMADRVQHLEEIVGPALEQGKIILSDRYVDSTIAYQVGGRLLSMDILKKLNEISTKGLMPQRTYILEIPVDIGLTRAQAKGRDRFEEEDLPFHKRVHDMYKLIAQENQKRCCVIDARGDKEVIHTMIYNDYCKVFYGK